MYYTKYTQDYTLDDIMTKLRMFAQIYIASLLHSFQMSFRYFLNYAKSTPVDLSP